jgi:hypothetical protein
MLASFAFMEKGECGCLVWRMNLLAVWFWFLFFMMSCGIKVPIGGLEYRRMVSCYFFKDGSSIK